MMLPVMGTWQNAYSSAYTKQRPLKLEAYRVNFSVAMCMTQADSRYAQIDGVGEVFETPLIRIDFPVSDGEGDCLSLYISGVLEEIEARIRDMEAK